MARATAEPEQRRILIVEDQAILGMELEFVLTNAGHQIVGIAVDTSQALTLADTSTPELAVVDVNLKDGPTGPKIAEAMAARGVTVLFATAEPELLPSQFAGAFGVVVKPYSAPSVQRVVDYCFALRDGLDPGPPPQHLHLAPWLVARFDGDGLN